MKCSALPFPTPVSGRAGEERAGSVGDRLQPPPNPHTRALRATQVPPRSGDGPGQRDRGAAAEGSAPPAPGKTPGKTLRVPGSGAGPQHPPPPPGGTTAEERRASAPRHGPCQRPAGGPARGGALNRPAVRPLTRAWRSAGPSLPASRHGPLPLAQTTPLRPSRAPPLPRAAIFAARRPRHLLGPPYLPGRRRWRRPSHT